MTQFDVHIDYIPPPPPKKMTPATGYIEVLNIKDGVNISISSIDESQIIFDAFEKNQKFQNMFPLFSYIIINSRIKVRVWGTFANF